MARATFNGSYGHNLQLEVTSGGSRQDVAGNYSMVNVQVRIIANGYAAIYETGGRSLSVNAGGTVRNVSINPYITQGQTKLIFEEELRVPHNSDGSKNISISARLDINSGGYDWATVSQNINLPTIARASTGTDVVGVIGSPITFNINRKHSAFKHAIWIRYGSFDKNISGNNIDTSFTWTPENSLCEQTPDNLSGFGTVTYITYSGNTEIGRDSRTIRLSVPDNAKPTFTGITLSDTNTVAQSLIPGNTFIQIISNIKVAFNGAKGVYGSTISGYKAEIVGKGQSTNVNGGTLGVMNYSGTVTIRASVSDSRGRWSDTKDVQVTVSEYSAPALSFSIARTGLTSSTLTVTRNARISPLVAGGVQKNTMALSFKVARLGTTNFTPDNGPAAGSWTSLSSLTNSQANLSGSYAANQSWVVIGTLEDRFTRTEFAINVATESVVFSYDRYGVGVNKIRERGALDVAGEIYANGKPIQQHRLTESSGSAITLNGGDWNDVVMSGYYMSKDTKNMPNSNFPWKYVRVTRHNNLWVLQEAIDFQGQISAYRVRINNVWQPWKYYAMSDHPMLKEKPVKTTTQAFPYGLNATLTRKGDMVTVTLNRRIATVGVVEYSLVNETIPSGYRPTAEAHLVIVPNAGSFTKSPSVLHLATDGKIRLTNGTGGQNVFTGTITYITTDPYP